MHIKWRTQSRLASIVEAFVNTAVGFCISIIATTFFLHLIGVKMTGNQLWWYTWFMTGISVARGYLLRRAWNAEFWHRLQWPKFWQLKPHKIDYFSGIHAPILSVNEAMDIDESTIEALRKAGERMVTEGRRTLCGADSSR